MLLSVISAVEKVRQAGLLSFSTCCISTFLKAKVAKSDLNKPTKVVLSVLMRACRLAVLHNINTKYVPKTSNPILDLRHQNFIFNIN